MAMIVYCEKATCLILPWLTTGKLPSVFIPQGIDYFATRKAFVLFNRSWNITVTILHNFGHVSLKRRYVTRDSTFMFGSNANNCSCMIVYARIILHCGCYTCELKWLSTFDHNKS